MQSPILPSPLCDKELEDIIFSAEVDAELKTNLCLPCWTSSAILTNEVQYSWFIAHVVFIILKKYFVLLVNSQIHSDAELLFFVVDTQIS